MSIFRVLQKFFLLSLHRVFDVYFGVNDMRAMGYKFTVHILKIVSTLHVWMLMF